jgi:hypothetical protein
MMHNRQMHSVLIHRYSAFFHREPPYHARPNSRPISLLSQEFHKTHFNPFTENVSEDILGRHLHVIHGTRRTKANFKLVESNYSTSDQQVRIKLWTTLFGKTQMPQVQNLEANEMASLDKYVRRGRRINENEMQTLFRRMRGKDN